LLYSVLCILFPEDPQVYGQTSPKSAQLILIRND
jgi:hypothetical protein